MKAMSNGEFGGDLLNSKQRVIVILTQDWCPQWHDLKGWIYRLDIEEDVDIYELEYNKADFFEDFRSFKENTFGNHSVPYLRFYKQGTLYSESNYISEGQVIEILGM